MKFKPSVKRKKFPNDWDAVEDALLALRPRQPCEAVPYAKCLEQILQVVDPAHESILGEECWSLIDEAQGDITNAIEYRENEIRLMRPLFRKMAFKNVLKEEGHEAASSKELSEQAHLAARTKDRSEAT